AGEGFSSPLRYPAANPGALLGVSCILFGLRGPTLNLIMPPADGVAPGLLAAAGWLQRGGAAHVIAAVCDGRDAESLRSRCLVRAAKSRAGERGALLGDKEVDWLVSSDR